MQMRSQSDMKSNIAKVRESNKEGFRVATIKSFHAATDTGNPSSHFTDEVRMTTPYADEDGKRLVGYCNVKHDGIEKPLQVDTVELWTLKADGYTPDRNYEDVFLSKHPSAKKIDVFDKDGNTVSFSEVEEKIADCAAFTVQFPHVMHYSEYMEFQNRNFARLKLDAPAGDGYAKYLEHCKAMMKSGNMPYVGEVTDADFVDMFKREIPEVDGMEGPETSEDFLP